MDTEQYLKLQEQLDAEQAPNAMSGELAQFVQVWVKSRMPQVYSELESRFNYLAPEIYAKREGEGRDVGF